MCPRHSVGVFSTQTLLITCTKLKSTLFTEATLSGQYFNVPSDGSGTNLTLLMMAMLERKEFEKLDFCKMR